MLRFCDREISCVEYESLNKDELRTHFLMGHLNDIVCVYDDCSTWEGFRGKITFHSLIQSRDVYDAIQREYVILDENIWTNARTYFKYCEDFNEETSMLPVLDRACRLLCFAYQDKTADRQLRMLRELDEISDALDFKELFPEYDCVAIYDCNELAYELAEYLRKRNIPVILNGSMWDYFKNVRERGNQEEYAALEYRIIRIYAEGTFQTKEELLPDVLRSVAPEFECIDQMYEAGILRGNIKDAAGDIEWLLERLRQEQEIVILGFGTESQNAYDYLLGKGIEARCFASSGQSGGMRLGKPILSEWKVKEIFTNPVFVDCETEYCAWGFGETDRYDCEGYHRNKSFFCLKDYVKIPFGYLPNALKGNHVVLVGNYNLCCNLNRILQNVNGCSLAYCDVLSQNSDKTGGIKQINLNEIVPDDIVLLVKSFYFGPGIKREEVSCLEVLQKWGICNVTEYFSDSRVLVGIQREDDKKYTLPCFTPAGILFEASGHMCGNSLAVSLWDNHPNVISMAYSFLKNNLCLICMQLAEEKPKQMLQTFWGFYDRVEDPAFQWAESNKRRFTDKFRELAAYKEAFTSQELFVILHVAYAYAYGHDVKDIQNTFIYWEPHDAPKSFFVIYEAWLSDRFVKGYSINITRNSYARVGPFFKHSESIERFVYPGLTFFWEAMEGPDFSQKEPVNWKRVEIKFETLKTSPQETLKSCCRECNIPWSDTLLETTRHGKPVSYHMKEDTVSGFDLKPVYNLYEEYFSDYDRFRINMVFADLQKKGNYPYVSCRFFSRRQIFEMFLKEWRFESRLNFKFGDSSKTAFRKNLFIKVNEYLQRIRRKEMLE